MKVSEAFLVNTKNFESIIETLVNYDADEIVINSNLLETLSYSDPNDLLVIRILKDFRVINNDGKPDIHFEEFHNPKTTKLALAKGLTTAYKGIFETYPKVHHNSLERIKSTFQEHFQGQKTDLIIKYISGTFEKIVSYVGGSTIDAVLNNELPNNKKTETKTADKSVLEETKEVAQAAHAKNHAVNGEKVSENNIDDILGDFEVSDSSNNISDSNSKPESTNGSPPKNEDPSIQEFLKSFKESDEEEKENTTDENPADKDIWGFSENGSNENDANIDQQSKQQTEKNSDIDPIDLEVPMSMATKTSNNMQQVTEEQKFVQKALIRKSDLLHKMKRWEELVPALEIIIEKFNNEEYTDFKGAVDQAFIRRAIALLKLGRTEQAMPALNSVIDKFKDSENPEFYEQASRAMLYKVSILEKKDPLSDQLLPLYNAIIDRLESTSEILINEKLDEIHCKRFDLLVESNEDASLLLEASTKLINRFKGNSKYRSYLQKSMMIRAEMLDEMNKDEAALNAYNEFLELFDN